jgi:hypothetical protein
MKPPRPPHLPLEPEIVSDEEAESCDLVVCCRVGARTSFTDNIHTLCARCGFPIFHRPHAPKRPPKVCIECAYEEIKENKGVLTPAGKAEVEAYRASKIVPFKR